MFACFRAGVEHVCVTFFYFMGGGRVGATRYSGASASISSFFVGLGSNSRQRVHVHARPEDGR